MNNVTLTGAVCMDCHKEWVGAMPRGFVYEDRAAGWQPQVSNGYLHGYCPPCAQVLADADHQEHVNGNWELRNLEDERYA